MAFTFRHGVLHAEQVPLDDIARRFGTPCYVYSRAAIERAYREFASAGAGRVEICYSVKANSNLAVLALLARLGAGFDIVSGGELALSHGIGCLNVESEAELERIDRIARRLGRRAPVALRVNPDIDAKTHPYISTGLRENKFGIAYDEAERLYRRAAGLEGIEIAGIGFHIGSLLLDAAPFVAAAERIVALVDRLEAAGIRLKHIDVGGGIGIAYKDERPQPVSAFVGGALRALGNRPHTLIFDPGRSIVGNAGVLLTRVEYVKPGAARNFLVVDAAMNDLLRPPLYGAWHEVRPVKEAEGAAAQAVYDVVGPVCESADFLAKERRLAAREGDLLAVMSAGAYGMVMSSNYNTRPRAAEILVDGETAQLVRRRESVDDLFALERI